MVDELLMTMTGMHDTVFGLSKCVCFVSILTIQYFFSTWNEKHVTENCYEKITVICIKDEQSHKTSLFLTIILKFKFRSSIQRGVT
jgi:hypothetical protein